MCTAHELPEYLLTTSQGFSVKADFTSGSEAAETRQSPSSDENEEMKLFRVSVIKWLLLRVPKDDQ